MSRSSTSGPIPTREEALDRSAEIAARIWNGLTPERQQELLDEAAADQDTAAA